MTGPVLGLIDVFNPTSWAKAIVKAFMAFVVSSVARQVRDLLDALFGFLSRTTEPVFSSGWWTSPAGSGLWHKVLGLSGGLLVASLMCTCVVGIVRGEPGLILQGVRNMCTAVFATAITVAVTAALVSGTDEMANYLDGGIVHGIGGTLPLAVFAAIGASDLVGIVLGLVLVLGVLAIWVELVLRAALIYLAVLSAPLVFAATSFPGLRASAKRFVEYGVSLVASKLVIALAFATASAEIHGSGTSTSFAQAIGVLVGALATMLIAVFAPFFLFKIFLLGEIAVAEGLSRRPLRLASTAQQQAFYARSGQGLSSYLGRRGSSAPGLAPPGGPGPGGPGGAGGPGTGPRTPPPGNPSPSGAAGGGPAGGGPAGGGPAGGGPAGGGASSGGRGSGRAPASGGPGAGAPGGIAPGAGPRGGPRGGPRDGGPRTSAPSAGAPGPVPRPARRPRASGRASTGISSPGAISPGAVSRTTSSSAGNATSGSRSPKGPVARIEGPSTPPAPPASSPLFERY